MATSAKVTTGSEKSDRGGGLHQARDAKGVAVTPTPVVNDAPVGPSGFALASNPEPSTPIKPTKNQRVSGYERDPDDWYCEPTWAVELLFQNIDFDEQTIWDPACGGGNIPRVAAEYGFDTLGTDKVDRGFEGVRIADFLTTEFVDCELPPRLSVVTNPPYKLTEQFIRRAMTLVDHRIAVLVPVSFMASKARFELFTETPPSDVLILCKRPSMPPGHKIAAMGDKAFKGGMVDFCWIVWTRPHDRETRVRWVL